MKVGDMVQWRREDLVARPSWDDVGLIIREIPGTAKRKVVLWNTGVLCSYPAFELELISESR